MYPAKLQNIIDLFEHLPEVERRETLVAYSDSASKQEPRAGEKFDLEDVRKDEECADTVGVYLQVDDDGKAHLRMTLGPEVQTLTRAMTFDSLQRARWRDTAGNSRSASKTSSPALSAPSSSGCGARRPTTC